MDVFQNDLRAEMGAPLYETKQTKSQSTTPTYHPSKHRKSIYEATRTSLQIQHLQQYCNRYKYEGLPEEIDPLDIERIIYFRGEIMAWYFEDLDLNLVLPYVGNSEYEKTIDFQGRWLNGKPMPFNGKSELDLDENQEKVAKYLGTISRELIYNTKKPGDKLTQAVPLMDYTSFNSQAVVPRSVLSQSIIDVQAGVLPMVVTLCKKVTRPDFVSVPDANVADVIDQEIRALDNATLQEKALVPIVTGGMDIKTTSTERVNALSDAFKVWESYKSVRLEEIGVDTGSSINKASHLLQGEQDAHGVSSRFILEDGLKRRQRWLELCNHVLGWNASVEINEKEIEEPREDGRAYGEETDEIDITNSQSSISD